MPEVGRQRQHGLIEVDALALPEQQALDGEGVAQLVQARSLGGTAVNPSQLVAQFDEDAMHLTLTQGRRPTGGRGSR